MGATVTAAIYLNDKVNHHTLCQLLNGLFSATQLKLSTYKLTFANNTASSPQSPRPSTKHPQKTTHRQAILTIAITAWYCRIAHCAHRHSHVDKQRSIVQNQ